MPLYDYVCPECGNREEHFRSLEERHNGPGCRCGVTMGLAIAAPAFKVNETFAERLNRNYDKRREKVATGEWAPNSLDRAKRSL